MFGKVIDSKSMIDKAVGVFEDVKKDLDSGIALCNQEEAELNDEIKALEAKRASVCSSRSKAQAVSKNIDNMFK